MHRTQTRKGTDVPYAAHLLGVAALVLEGGGTQREAIAALLHDSLEDTSATPKQIRKRYGSKVARIVVACTDVPVGKSGKRKKPRHGAANWHERKDARTRTPERSAHVGVRSSACAPPTPSTTRARRSPISGATDRRPGALQRRCRRPALVLPVALDRALPPAPRPPQRRAARHRARAGEPGRVVVRRRRPANRSLNESGGTHPTGGSRVSAPRTAMLGYTAVPCTRPARRGPCSGIVMPHAAAAARNASRCSAVGGAGRSPVPPSAGRCGSVTP